jgi:hypothetical protein
LLEIPAVVGVFEVNLGASDSQDFPLLVKKNRPMQRSFSSLSAAKPIHCALDSGACPGSPVSSYAACSVTASFQMK